MTTAAIRPTTPLQQRYRDADIAEPDRWNPVLETIHNHRSVRHYLDEDVSDATVQLLVSAAQSAATSSNLQTWSVIVVRDEARKSRLATLAGNQTHIVDAPVLLVWTADFARLRQLAADNAVPLDGADYLESSYVGVIDAALAAQNAVTAAESLGLGTVFIGAIRNHPEEVAAELELPPHVFAVFGLVVGQPDPVAGSYIKPRLPQQAVLHEETYRLEPQREHVATYEQRIGDFYAEQHLEHSWKARVLARLASPASLSGRHRLREQLANLGFPLR
ncbi:NADPH-dependent oxidoreductase [Antrihabitans cavernicola]|uniref:NADPH-dependent oxidoreductase n=1 Tax=Antrihabitans cavernicola TaxID=2495913 RepID=A0A5A7S4E9_9NOCA|nr:NADPH-dependent oxidoreductase [Spelaeibacter cavernicola]KAA0018085.1 NADPH-dependent oxidoreductase [Spelaeibacter cavernicola]